MDSLFSMSQFQILSNLHVTYTIGKVLNKAFQKRNQHFNGTKFRSQNLSLNTWVNNEAAYSIVLT